MRPSLMLKAWGWPFFLFMKYIVFNKPFGVLSQFTQEVPGQRTLAEFSFPKGVYAAGRLDKDSEGLLVLTDDGQFNKKLTRPQFEKNKVYWVQVEGAPSDSDFKEFRSGLLIKDYKTLPAKVRILKDFEFPPRNPPIRERKNIPTTWIEVTIHEGKNRQVRKMCAAIGFPCLRLIRAEVGHYKLGDLPIGQWREVSPKEILA